MDTDPEIGQEETTQTKACTKCGITKHLTDYHKSNYIKSGFQGACKECDRAKGRAYYAANADKVNARVDAARKADPEKKKAQGRAWYEKNKESNHRRSKAWRLANPEKSREFTRNHHAKNPLQALERGKRRRETALGKLENAIRVGFHRGLKNPGKAGRKTFELLGYTSTELKAHIERLFLEGMSWDNYGHGEGCWHVDHKIPLAAHNYETPHDIDFKRAWALRNLQPMWSHDNITKGARFVGNFQPSLAIHA